MGFSCSTSEHHNLPLQLLITTAASIGLISSWNNFQITLGRMHMRFNIFFFFFFNFFVCVNGKDDLDPIFHLFTSDFVAEITYMPRFFL